jgi:hypothetical protein
LLVTVAFITGIAEEIMEFATLDYLNSLSTSPEKMNEFSEY